MPSTEGFKIKNNVGAEISIPQTAEDDYAYFTPDQTEDIRRYYDEHGYVVIRGAIPARYLDTANAAFDQEVLPSTDFIYRQATANAEKNVFTDHGFMLNSILNPQSVNPRTFGDFRARSTAIYATPELQGAVKSVLGENGKLVQGMYFHGNPSTWPHQDSYYLDSEKIGAMTAVWIAAEDIAPGAGRFFIYPKSHRMPLGRHDLETNIGTKHDEYKRRVEDLIHTSNLECRAPALRKGDLLFWNALTIHGSLPTSQPQFSRRSFTAHFIPQSQRFLQYQKTIKPMAYDEVSGALISRAKDQSKAINRAILFVESRFPTLYHAVRRAAIQYRFRRGTVASRPAQAHS